MATGKKNFTIVGVGNCGSQVANLAEKKYPAIFDCIYINTSETDLSMVNTNTTLKFKIGDKEEVEGSGKNRTTMKKYLKDDIMNVLGREELQICVSEKKYCAIVTSTAGGTGSGAGPVLTKFMINMFPDTHFILVAVLPKMSCSLAEYGNTLEYMHELYDVLGSDITYMIYDNDTASNIRNSIEALEHVNENIVEDLRVLSGIDNYPTPYESIDEADMESIITTPGRLLVTRLTSGITEKSMEDTDISKMIINAIKKSSHAEIDRDKNIIRRGIITYFTKEVNKLFDSSFDELNEFIGTPIESFNHNAVNDKDESMNFMHVIFSGLSPINDRVTKITNMVEKLKGKLPEQERGYILAGDSTSYDALAIRKKQEKRANQAEEVSKNDVFSQFGV